MGWREDYNDGKNGVVRPFWERSVFTAWGEEDRAKAMAANVRTDSDGSQALALFALPLFYWPGLLLWRTWVTTAAQHPDWEPLYKLAPSAVELVGMLVALSWFYRVAPRWLGGLAMGAYFAAAYGFGAMNFAQLDQNWCLGIAAVAFLIGNAFGRGLVRA